MVLTIANSGILAIDFANHSLTVTDTGGVLVKQGGSLAQTGRLSPPPSSGSTENLLVFHHSDHLTGASVDTDTTGTMIQLTDYYPFGDSRIEDTTTAFHNDYTYTGKERDEDTDLLYYEARYYDSTLGRFLSLDPWKGDITDPQSLNKYAYVRNNPLKYVDPEGEIFILFNQDAVLNSNLTVKSNIENSQGISCGGVCKAAVSSVPGLSAVDSASVVLKGKDQFGEAYSIGERAAVLGLGLLTGGAGKNIVKALRTSDDVIKEASQLSKQLKQNSVTMRNGDTVTRYDMASRSGSSADMSHFDKATQTSFIGPHVQRFKEVKHFTPTGKVYTESRAIEVRNMTKSDIKDIKKWARDNNGRKKKKKG